METENLKFPSHLSNARVRRFLTQLLDKQPSIRLGGSYSALKAHKWFDSVDWDKLYHKAVEPEV
jgi:cGMP-dependent protein kinase